MKRRNRRKLFVLLMIFCLTFTMMPTLAFAAGEAGAEEAAAVAEPLEAAAASEQAEEKSEAAEAPTDADKTPDQPAEAEAVKESPEQAEPADKEEPSEEDSSADANKADANKKEDTKKTSDKTEEAKKDSKEEEFDWLTYEAVDPSTLPKGFKLMGAGSGSSTSYKADRNSADAMQFSTDLNGLTFYGVCCEPAVKAYSSGKASLVKLSKESLSRKIAWKYKAWRTSDTRDYDFGGLKRAVILEAMLQYANHPTAAKNHWKDNNGWSSSTRQAIIDAVNDLKNNETSETLDIPNNFTAYRLEIENSDSNLGQDGVIWGYPVDGKVRVRKKVTASAEALYAQDPDKYSVKGAKFTLYDEKACTTRSKDVYGNNAICTISDDGINVVSNTLTMEVGTYYLKETKKPSSGAYDYERDSAGKVVVHKVEVEKDETVTITVTDDATTNHSGYLNLKKSSDLPGITNGNAMYSLEGARYQVYTKETCTAEDKATDINGDNAMFVTEEDGTAEPIEFDLGDGAEPITLKVWVKETSAPQGYAKDTRVYGPYTVTENTPATAAVANTTDTPIFDTAGLTLIKKGDPQPDPQALVGAEFEIRYYAVANRENASSSNLKATWKFATSVKGSGASAYAGIDLQTDRPLSGTCYVDDNGNRVWPLGTYQITETKAPSGYIKDSTPTYVYVTVTGNNTAQFSNARIEITNEQPSHLYIKKVNASGAALSGATLQIFDGNTAVGSSWVSDGTDHEITGLDGGKTYTLRELAAPAGYDIAPDQTFKAPESGTVTVSMTNVPVTVGTTAKSGTTNTQTGARKSNETIKDTVHMTGLTTGREYKIVGTLMNKRTGQAVADVTVSPVIFTATAATMDKEMTFTFDSRTLADNDEVVVYETLYRTSKANASENLPAAGKEIASHRNINDAGQTVKYPPIPVKIKKVNTATGAVLQGAKIQIVQGSVVAAEWTTDATEWHEVKNLEPGDYVLREVSAPYGFDIANDIPFTFDGISAKSITMNNTPVTVSTTAVSKATGKHIGPRKANEVITDTVHMTGLITGRQYRLTGKLMNKRTGQAVTGVTAPAKTFTATGSTMDVAMDLTFDSTQLADGDTVVVYETLHRMTKVHNETVPAELGKHENINDAGQSVIYPGISTVAIDQSSQTHNLLAGPNATIVDTVTYKGILPGVAYTLEGELFDKTTNRLTGIKATGTIPATASANGTATVTFTFDASGMENHTLVVYETLKLGTVILTEHKDPSDKDQTIYIPEVKTTLTDTENKDHLSNADETVTVQDEVVCNNLIVGRTYKISGKLVYKDNGNDVLDNGRTVTAETQPFEATATTMTKTLTFTFNGSALEGKTVIAFEDLYTNNRKVGTHADLSDEKQADHLPKVRTTALDSETNDHISLGDESITIHDTVSYENLIPGKTYTVTGRLMDKTTGNEIANVTSQPVEFKPDKANGTVVVDFVFNGRNWQNHKAVAFEKLYLGTKDQVKPANLIGLHENLNDVDQTVHIPEIKTTLKDTKTTDHIAFAETTVTLKDTIEYKNLIKGKEYVATGRLMNKRTGEPVKVNGAEVVSEPVKFTAPDENGSVVVTFIFNGVALAGEKVVAFEKVTYKNIPIAVHENIEDKAQTVHLPKIRTVAAISDDNHVFTDTINYENLLPDRKYVFRGWLVDTATGTKIPGSDGKVDLEANEANVNGSVKMEMNTEKYDDMYGHSMTAFEELYVIENINGTETEVKVAEHKDRTGDANTNPQTIEIYHDLKVQKNVTGNLGDLTKNFEYTVEFTDLVPGVTYTVEGDDSKTFKAGADGKATVELILADDESVTIKQIPKSATYVVTEAASDHVAEYKIFSEDMADKGAKIVTKEANNGAEAAKMLATAKETVDLFDGTIVVLWQNNRDLATLTGVQTYLGIWAGALALVLAGIVTILARRRRYMSAE